MAASDSKHPESRGGEQVSGRHEAPRHRPQSSQLLALVGSYGVASLVFSVLAVLALMQHRDWIWIASYVVLATASMAWVVVVLVRQRAQIHKRTQVTDSRVT